MGYIVVIAILVLLRSIDLYITYRITPDLTLEWNPLVSSLHFGWKELIITQLVFVLLGVLAFQRYATRIRCPVDKPGLGIVQFVYFYFNRHEADIQNWMKSFFKFPNKYYLRINGAFIGFVVVCSFILASAFAIAHNLLILYAVDAYLDFVYNYNNQYMVSVWALIVILGANLFFVLEYREYRKTMSQV
jgi:hypothetical protein